MNVKKLVAIILCFSMAVLSVTASAIEVQEAEIPISAPSALLMHTNGQMLFSKNQSERRAPASVTKIMTLLLVMEAIENGSISYEDIVIGSAHAASMGGSQIWLKEGETFTVREMIKCVAVASANDCSVALAEHIAGSEEAFVALMNKRAKELGMQDTSFVNCCGLEAPGHYTSAYDVALMSLELMRHQEITEYTTIWMDTIRDGAFGLTNTNKMLKTYSGMVGLKTGYTREAGYCLSAVAQRDGMTLVAVVLGGATSNSRNQDVAALLNYGFANYAQAIPTPDRPLMPVEVILGKKDAVGVALEPVGELLLKKGQIGGLEKRIEMVEIAEAPIYAGDRLGSFGVYLDGQLLLEVDIVACEDVEKKGVLDIWAELLAASFMREGAKE